ncbi:MAG: preprotein translocase subunit SecG [Planctomycetota bacterium]|jgi:preprotein translocase subunit SecG
MELIQTVLYLIFVFSAITLIVVILLQEGKGGGFGSALGTAGQQTFGVATKGIQNFTGIIAVIFMVSAVTIHIVVRQNSSTSLVGSDTPSLISTDDGAGAGSAPATGGGTDE